MDSGDGKEKGGITAARKGEEMKSLEKATADYEKAKENIRGGAGSMAITKILNIMESEGRNPLLPVLK